MKTVSSRDARLLVIVWSWLVQAVSVAKGVCCHFVPVIKPSFTCDAMNFPKCPDSLEGGSN